MSTNWPFGDLPYFGFDIGWIDFPWAFDLWSETGNEKSPQAYYDTMTVDEACDMPIGQLFAKDSIALIWMTHPMLDRQMKVISAWGMRFVTSGVWVKRNSYTGNLAFGPGYWLRCASEPFVLATMGSPEIKSRSIRTVIEGPARGHSVKPEQAYAVAERMCPDGRRLDLFSRKTRPGWTSWGNQSGLLDNQPRAPKRALVPAQAEIKPADFFGEALP
ncbi:MT-A70 family methyltransferase [Pleomorphomonas sp. PLEO]|uniref:MT-A70 family methyltransferase n=1 Tax=Pleomorphomonas sp. PLEO TaxID=3239306 RepID=UPI00351F786F